MNEFESDTYGNAFADVYDEWYADVSDVAATVTCLSTLAARLPDAPVIELGVGTGRLALPLATAIAPQQVIGIDASAAMLAVLATKQAAEPTAPPVQVIKGDMVDDLPPMTCAVIFVAYNTFFSLSSPERQQHAFHAVARRLASGGTFVIEAFVPRDETVVGDHVAVRTLTSSAVVLSVSKTNADGTVDGQFIQFSEAAGVRLRPWSILPATPDRLDAMAAAAGLGLLQRWETFAGEPFTVDCARHVSVYGKS